MSTALTTLREVTDAYKAAQYKYANAREQEQRIEDERPLAKIAAIKRIMESGPNETNGKPHSATSAEAMVETDLTYMAYLSRRREAVLYRMTMEANRNVAYLHALAAAMATGVAGHAHV